MPTSKSTELASGKITRAHSIIITLEEPEGHRRPC
jgi:hypothetical protein